MMMNVGDSFIHSFMTYLHIQVVIEPSLMNMKQVLNDNK